MGAVWNQHYDNGLKDLPMGTHRVFDLVTNLDCWYFQPEIEDDPRWWVQPDASDGTQIRILHYPDEKPSPLVGGLCVLKRVPPPSKKRWYQNMTYWTIVEEQ